MKHRILSWSAALILYLLYCISGTLYSNYDNYNCAIVINGLLGNNNLCQHQHPLFCILLKGVSVLLPNADSFTLTVHVLLIAALGWVIFLLIEKFTDRIQRLLICAFVLYLSLCVNIWNVNYTVQGAFFCFTGFLGLFFTCDEGKKTKKRIAEIMAEKCGKTSKYCFNIAGKERS